MDIKNLAGDVLLSVTADTLRGADLRGADLYEANLRGANLRGANLREADLREANLCEANLCEADLREANLYEANLYEANLYGANLYGADLRGADLRGADLYEANLYEANLYGADLRGADLPAPGMMLLSNWGNLSDGLTRMCMRYDAANHADPAAFNTWKETGECPYRNAKYLRCVNFTERRDLWDAGLLDTPVPTAYELMVALIREKCKDSDYHDHEGER